MKLLKNGNFELKCSDRELIACEDTIGLCMNPRRIDKIMAGYDDCLDRDYHFTVEERLEIANYMIKQWKAFRNSLK